MQSTLCNHTRGWVIKCSWTKIKHHSENLGSETISGLKVTHDAVYHLHNSHQKMSCNQWLNLILIKVVERNISDVSRVTILVGRLKDTLIFLEPRRSESLTRLSWNCGCCLSNWRFTRVVKYILSLFDRLILRHHVQPFLKNLCPRLPYSKHFKTTWILKI